MMRHLFLFFLLPFFGCGGEKEDGGENGDGYTVTALTAFFPLANADMVSLVDLEGREEVGLLPGGDEPHGGCVTPDGTKYFSASMGDPFVTAVDVETGKVLSEIDVGGMTHHAAASRDGSLVFITVMYPPMLVSISTESLEVVDAVELAGSPDYPALNPEGTKIYVSSGGGANLLYEIPLEAMGSTEEFPYVEVGEEPGHVAVSEDGSKALVTNYSEGTVTAVSTSPFEVEETIEAFSGVHGVAFVPGKGIAYVTGGSRFMVIDSVTNEVLAEGEKDGMLDHVAGSPDGSLILVNDLSGRIHLLDPLSTQEKGSVDVSGEPHQTSFPFGIGSNF